MTRTCSSTASPVKITPACSTIRTRRWSTARRKVYPPASTVKPYVAVSALSAGVITRNTSLFDPGWWQLPGSDKRYRDWKNGATAT
ncbi:hypothetical protein LNO81_07390 [Klebsiella variicola subsp. variicola]|nr:hypothetical protein [Klebsiella variicola subsp. variicola]